MTKPPRVGLAGTRGGLVIKGRDPYAEMVTGRGAGARERPMIRGCGTRVAGGIYAVVGLSPWGRPIEDFLTDPSIPIDTNDFNLSPIGVLIVKTDGPPKRSAIFDWIGEEHYPTPAHFVEEVRRKGVSRRLSSKSDFSELDAASTLVLCHPKAYLENWEDLWRPWSHAHTPPSCPKSIHLPLSAASNCAAHWWVREVPGRSGHEWGFERWTDIEVPYWTSPTVRRYSLGTVMRVPLDHIEVVRDKVGGAHTQAMEIASEARVPVHLVEE